MEFLDSDLSILAVEIGHEGPNETVRVRANFSRPIYVAGKSLFPFGWHPGTEGWMEVNLTLGGILQYAAFTIIVVLAWPITKASELALRIAITAPLIALLLLIQVPFMILAEFWFPVHNDIDPHSFWPLLAWSRFLMGGGGVAAAILIGVVAILLARRWADTYFCESQGSAVENRIFVVSDGK